MIEWAGTVWILAKEALGYIKDANEFFDTGKAIYEDGKEAKEHFEIKLGDPKLIDFAWIAESGFQAKAEQDGYRIAFSRPDKVARRELDGYELMYEIDRNPESCERSFSTTAQS
jgi:hypothetical protein